VAEAAAVAVANTGIEVNFIATVETCVDS
jgi:hypothetical protein